MKSEEQFKSIGQLMMSNYCFNCKFQDCLLRNNVFYIKEGRMSINSQKQITVTYF